MKRILSRRASEQQPQLPAVLPQIDAPAPLPDFAGLPGLAMLPVELPLLQPNDVQMSQTVEHPVPADLLQQAQMAMTGTPVNKVKHARSYDETGGLKQDKLTTRLKAPRATVDREGSDDLTLGTPDATHNVSQDLVLKGEYLTEPGKRQTIETTAASLSPEERSLLGSSAPMTRRTKQVSTQKQDGAATEDSTTTQLQRMGKDQRRVLGLEQAIGWPVQAADPAQRLLIKGEQKTTTNGPETRDQDIQTHLESVSAEQRLAVGIGHDQPMTQRTKRVVKQLDGNVIEDQTTRNLRVMPKDQRTQLGITAPSRALDRDAHDFTPQHLTVKDEHKTTIGDGETKTQQIDTKALAISDEDRLAMGMTHRAPLTERSKHVVTENGDNFQDKRTTDLGGMSKKIKGLLGVPRDSAPLPGGLAPRDVTGQLTLKSERMTQINDDRRKEQTITSTLRNPPAEFEASGKLPWIERRKQVTKFEADDQVSDKTKSTWRPMSADERTEYGYDISGDAFRDVRQTERTAKRAHKRREANG